VTAPSTSWFIHGGLVIDPIDGEPRRRELIVHDGTIAASLEPGPVALAAGFDLPCVDATDLLIVPGLVNAHTHGHANLMKGVADRWPLELSLTHGPWMSGARDLETIYVSTLLGAIEMLANGITSCCDLVYEFPRASAAGLRTVAQAYADAGMRAVIAPMIADRSFFDAYPEVVASMPPALAARVRGFALAPMDETLAAVREIVSGPPMPDGVRLGIAPTIPLHCSDTFLAACRDLAAAYDLPMQMHIAESRLQATAGTRAYGVSLTEHLAAMDLLRPSFTAAHGVWLGERDLDLIAESGASIAHVPASNFRLGSGIAHVRPMLDRGINVALATDGANSSDSLDMLDAMRLASFASRSYCERSDRWLSSTEALRAATIGGAQALGFGERVGRPIAGAYADLTFFDLTHPAFVPLNDPLNQIVNGDAARAIAHVMAGGRFALRDRAIAAWTPALRERIAAARERLRSVTRPARELADELAPFVLEFAGRSAAGPFPIERFVRSTSYRVKAFVS
jgi:cytosine/adenosine deaminase-related metal-dependent hydrolase